MSIYKRGQVYWYKFTWQGESIRESTKQGNDRKARNMEAAHRAALANGLVGIRERKPAPALADFLKNDFLSFAEKKHAAKLLPFATIGKAATCSPSPRLPACD